jgi:TolB-like protein/Tfp pilus assembly protein PilF
MLPDGLTVEEISAALAQLLSAPDFQTSERNKRFLRYVVEETLAERGDRIKSYAIAVDVFGRGVNFDSAADSIVRTEATRLRAALTKYYAAAGARDAIRILLPPGSYVPQFERIEPAPPPAPPAPPAQTADNTRPLAASPSPRPPALSALALARRGWLILGALLVMAALVLLAGQTYRHWFFSPQASIRPLIVLARTQTIGEDPKVRYLAPGLEQSLITNLTRDEGVVVVQATERLPVETIVARRQDAGGAVYILESSVDVDESRLRFRWRLIAAAEKTVLWSDQVDEPLNDSDALNVEDRIAEGVARVVSNNNGIVVHFEQDKRPTRSTLGYACVLRGFAYLRSQLREAHAEARECLEATVAQNPQDAEAWALLSYVYLDEDRNGFDPRGDKQEIMKRALAASDRAVQLAPWSSLAQQMNSLVLFHNGEDRGFEQAGRKAIALNPNSATRLIFFGNRLFALGRYDEGAAFVRKGIALEPFPNPVDHMMSLAQYYRLGDYRAAAEEGATLDADANYYGLSTLLAATYAQLGDKARAATYVAKLLKQRPDYANPKALREDLHNRRFRDDFIDKLAEGLTKAGLPQQ